MKYIRQIITILLVFIFLVPNKAEAVLKIDITHGNLTPLPIALPEFSGDNPGNRALGKDLIKVLTNDLESSGLFESIDKRAFIQQIKGVGTIPRFREGILEN